MESRNAQVEQPISTVIHTLKKMTLFWKNGPPSQSVRTTRGLRGVIGLKTRRTRRDLQRRCRWVAEGKFGPREYSEQFLESGRSGFLLKEGDDVGDLPGIQ